MTMTGWLMENQGNMVREREDKSDVPAPRNRGLERLGQNAVVKCYIL